MTTIEIEVKKMSLSLKEIKYGACLQYNMLIIPAKSRGMMEIVPFHSSILSMIKIAMIDVNAIVIYSCHEEEKI